MDGMQPMKQEDPLQECKLLFSLEAGQENIEIIELINFLFLFNKVYSNYAWLYKSEDDDKNFSKQAKQEILEINSIIEDMQELSDLDYTDDWITSLNSLPRDSINTSFFDKDNEVLYQLQIKSINKNSPMKIVFIGIPVALTMAIIFSGGKVKTKDLEFELPPIGIGIESLSKALQSSNNMDTKKSPKM
jgi:hypothetical protein